MTFDTFLPLFFKVWVAIAALAVLLPGVGTFLIGTVVERDINEKVIVTSGGVAFVAGVYGVCGGWLPSLFIAGAWLAFSA